MVYSISESTDKIAMQLTKELLLGMINPPFLSYAFIPLFLRPASIIVRKHPQVSPQVSPLQSLIQHHPLPKRIFRFLIFILPLLQKTNKTKITHRHKTT